MKMKTAQAKTLLTAMAYWIMCRAIEQDPNSAWAKEATDQWLRYLRRTASRGIEINAGRDRR